jgi:hypothetical protein
VEKRGSYVGMCRKHAVEEKVYKINLLWRKKAVIGMCRKHTVEEKGSYRYV